MGLSYEEAEVLIAVARDATLGNTFEERLAATTEAVLTLVPGTSLSAIVITPPDGSVKTQAFTRNVDLTRAIDYATHYIQHDPMKVVVEHATGTPALLSDFLTSRTFGRDPFTGEFLKELGLRHILGCVNLMPDGLRLSLAIHRENGLDDFSKHELELVRLAAPEIARAAFASRLKQLVADLARTQPTGLGDVGAIVFGRQGDVIYSDESGQRCLQQLHACEMEATITAEVKRLTSPRALEATTSTHVLELPASRWFRIRFTVLGNGVRATVLALVERLQPGSPELIDALSTRAGLTPRERDVAALAVKGLGNRQIAAELRISPVTVNIHLGRVYQKTGAPTRTELAALLLGGKAG
jgi:DNA-binding CsgD family transcriptional regulator